MVSNSQFEAALADPDNRGVLRGVSRYYAAQLSADERRSCCLLALYRAIQGHRDGLGQKFTTSLYRFASWELSREAKRAGKTRPHCREAPEPPARAERFDPEDLEHVLARMGLLQDWEREIVQMRFLSGMSVTDIAKAKGYSRQTASWRLGRAMGRLRSVCLDGVGD